jgi:hypothetical protein
MKRWVFVLSLLLIPRISAAQLLSPSPQSVSVQDSGTKCATAQTCASWQISGNAPTLVLQMTGTCSCTITFEATADGSTWFSIQLANLSNGTLATTSASTGQFAITNSGIVGLRARATTVASGGLNITLTRGQSGAIVR